MIIARAACALGQALTRARASAQGRAWQLPAQNCCAHSGTCSAKANASTWRWGGPRGRRLPDA
eukprot:14967476-Alexandrium_andersonii.AAC.1